MQKKIKPLPEHLQKIVDNNMKTNQGRNLLAGLANAGYYRSVEGKIKKVKR